MTEDMGRVCVVGLGYVGVPTAAVLAGHGMEVIGVDIDRERVETINSGTSPFDEPGLDSLVAEVVASGALSARGEPAPADAFIIAVPTPIREDRSPDLSYVRAAVDNLAPVLGKGDLVVVESTCPVGTTERVCEWLTSSRPDLTFPHSAGEASDIRRGVLRGTHFAGERPDGACRKRTCHRRRFSGVRRGGQESL